MPAKSAPAPAVEAPETAARIAADAQKAIADAAKRIEAAVARGMEQVRTQSKVYADAAGDQIDEAAKLASDHIRARPLISTGAALGIGILIGLLIAPRR